MNRRRLKKRIKNAVTNRKNRPLIYAGLFTIAAAATALACGWSYITDHSVRFNTYRTGRGFYRLPPLPIMYDAKTGKELSVNQVYDEEEVYDDNAAIDAPIGNQVWEQARTAGQEKRLGVARDLLEKYLEITALARIDQPDALQGNRNTAQDILDAMSALSAGSSPESVSQYITARYAYQFKDQDVNALIGQAVNDKNLDDNWDYLRAAVLFSEKQNDAALEAFRGHATKHPRSEKNEAVLYMIAKLEMEMSYSFAGENCGIEGENRWGEPLDHMKIEPTEKCRDDRWKNSLAAFEKLLDRYPNGRYSNDARGWMAFLFKRGSERAKALAEYYSLLAHPTDLNARLKAKRSLQMIGHAYNDAVLDEVEKIISNDANVALSYAYHRIYNHAIDLSYTAYDEWCCSGDDRWKQELEEKKRVKKTLDEGRHELDRVAKFATSMMRRYPNSKVSGGFVLRVAEAQLELDNYAEAEAAADKVLSLGLEDDARAEALWVKGSSHHYQKELKAARSTFTQLVAEFPKGRLTEGARRLLALTAEDQDDLEFALEQYLSLGYQYDVAYYVDVLLPTDRLAKFIKSRKRDANSDFLAYALGVRLMRDKSWSKASAVLQQVRTETAPVRENIDDDTESLFSKDPDWEWKDWRQIKTSWVMQDLKTIEALEHLEKNIEIAPDDEAKAEAMYQFASFQFESDDLLFYNPAGWKGQRYWLLDQLADSENVRFSTETQSIFEHSQQHEGLSRSIPIFLEIVNRFPNTRAAKDALYSAAVAHERVSNLNPYWRDIYSQGLFAGPRNIGFADVRSFFPKYRFPKSSEGWEPSTRTVNGGPGWDPKPKPAPPLTRTQKFERRLKYASGKFSELVKPKIDSATTWVGSIFSGYVSVINYALSWLLTVVVLMLGGYFALLGFHYRTWLLAAARRLSGPEIALEQIPTSDSRIEKVIDDSH